MTEHAVIGAGRFRTEKRINLMLCAAIFILGVSSYITAVITDAKGDFLSLFRFMTINGTLLSTLAAFCTFCVNLIELRLGAELYSRAFYLLRLSSAVTECVIALVIALSLLPFIPDDPKLLKYDSFCMHVLIPPLTIASFVINDLPGGRLRHRERFSGSLPVALYAAVMIPMILIGAIPQKRIPYSFMRFYDNPIWFSLSFAAMLLILTYVLTSALSAWNRGFRRRWLMIKKEADQKISLK